MSATRAPVVLVIDDEKHLRMLLRENLAAVGIETMEAGSGKDGIELAMRRPPELALVDIGLPDLSGWKVCERLQAHPRTRRIQLIVQSGAVGKEIEAIARSYDINYWVYKPYDCGTVVELVKDVLTAM